MNIAHRLMDHARINPISEPNKVKRVSKGVDGSLRVTLNSGRTYKISKEDEMFQAFAVYTVLADL
ncbi:hypothetical protein [Rhodanobacter lindaniclasticus]|uniref:hypothetical protein n=1 Tax=Rhodanobacter lindaniclasticus TaxID=75310 RepID=UPI00109F16E4|nr:hypothetical protein [Rhodanobacter lindaniclasticus]